MTNIKKLVSHDFDLFTDLAAVCGFSSATGLIKSSMFIYQDKTIDGILYGVGMDQVELEKMLYRGSDTLGYSNWSLYYLKKNDQYILINEFY